MIGAMCDHVFAVNSVQTNPILRLCGCATVQVCAGRDGENGCFWTRRALHSFSSLFQRLPLLLTLLLKR